MLTKNKLTGAHNDALNRLDIFLSDLRANKVDLFHMWTVRSAIVEKHLARAQASLDEKGDERFRGILVPPPWDRARLGHELYLVGLDGQYHLAYLTICLPEISFYFGVCSDQSGIERSYFGSGKIMLDLRSVYKPSDFIRLPVAFMASVDLADALEEAVVDDVWRRYEWTNNVINGGRTGRGKLDVGLPVLVMYRISKGGIVRGTRDELLKLDARASKGGLNRLISHAKGGHSDFIWCGYARDWDTLGETEQRDHIRFNRAYSMGGSTIERVVFDLDAGEEYFGYQFELNLIAKSRGFSKIDELLREKPGEMKYRSWIYCGTLADWRVKSSQYREEFIATARQRFSAKNSGADNPRLDRTEYVLLDRKDGSILMGTRWQLKDKTAGSGYPLRNTMFSEFGRNRRYTVLTVRSAWMEMPEGAKRLRIEKAMRY